MTGIAFFVGLVVAALGIPGAWDVVERTTRWARSLPGRTTIYVKPATVWQSGEVVVSLHRAAVPERPFLTVAEVDSRLRRALG
jgi:hypothetical protein